MVAVLVFRKGIPKHVPRARGYSSGKSLVFETRLRAAVRSPIFVVQHYLEMFDAFLQDRYRCYMSVTTIRKI